MHSRFRISVLILAGALASACGDSETNATDEEQNEVRGQDGGAATDTHDVGNQTLDAQVGQPSARDPSAQNGSSSSEREGAETRPLDPGEQNDGGTLPLDGGRDIRHDAGRRQDAGRASDAGITMKDASLDACGALTYDNFGKQFVQTYCASCHQSGARITLASMTDVQMLAGKAESELTRTAMPPRGSKQPTSDERQRAIQWLNCGAP